MMEYFALDVSSLQFVETALAGNVESSEFREYVAEIKPFLLDPLKHKVCDYDGVCSTRMGDGLSWFCRNGKVNLGRLLKVVG